MKNKEHQFSPPKKALQLLRWFCRFDMLEDIEGDLVEFFHERSLTLGKTKAKWLFLFDVLLLFRPGIVKQLKFQQYLTSNVMIKNHLKFSYRNLLKHKIFSFINIMGLAVGMASALLITLYVQNEKSYDSYHQQKERIYRLKQAFVFEEDWQQKPQPEATDYQIWGNAPVGKALSDNFPQIQEVVQFSGRRGALVEYKDLQVQENDLFNVSKNVFEVFDWHLIAGDENTALEKPYSIVLTESTAYKYFGVEDPIGKALLLDNVDEYIVTGIMNDIPHNSHFRFDMLTSISTMREQRSDIFDMWGYVDFYTYFLMNDENDIATIREKLPEVIEANLGDDFGYYVGIESLKDAYLNSEAIRQPGVTGSLTNIFIFTIIGFFILAIACINFMNLTTARSIEKAREVGVRKSMGAHRWGLIGQFLMDSVFQSLIAFVMAIILVWLLFPFFETLTGKILSMDVLLSVNVMLILGLSWLWIGLLAGLYPSFVLSGFDPVKVLKGKFKSSFQGIMLRKALVIFQFTLSIALMAGTAIIYTQMNYMQSSDLGFNKDQMLIIDFGFDEDVQNHMEAIKSSLKSHPAVNSVSASRTMPGGHYPQAYTEIEGEDGLMKTASLDLYEIGIDFIDHFEIEMITGRPYSRKFMKDTIQSMIINETAARKFGYNDPERIIGKRFTQWGREGEVIGVTKDFNYQSLHHNVEPLTLRFAPDFMLGYLSLKIDGDNIPETINEIKAIWAELAPQRPFLYSFLDESFDRQYEADIRFAKVFGIFGLLALMIACLGLFGLAAYAASLRTKEIGVRKVLGASISSVVRLLSFDFIKLVIVAILIATPIAWYAMNAWLEHYAYRVEFGIGVFVVMGGISIVIAFLTIGGLSLKAALENPANSLKDE